MTGYGVLIDLLVRFRYVVVLALITIILASLRKIGKSIVYPMYEYIKFLLIGNERKELKETLNTIQNCWHYGGLEPDTNDRKRIYNEMERSTDELQKYRDMSNTSEGTKEFIADLISEWDKNKQKVRENNRNMVFERIEKRIKSRNIELKRKVQYEEKGPAQKVFLAIRSKIISIPKYIVHVVLKIWFFSFPFELYIILSSELKLRKIVSWLSGDGFLYISREIDVDLVSAESKHSDYNLMKVTVYSNVNRHEIDEYGGRGLKHGMLIRSIEASKFLSYVEEDAIVSENNEKYLVEIPEHEN
jgi:hypothetical protein